MRKAHLLVSLSETHQQPILLLLYAELTSFRAFSSSSRRNFHIGGMSCTGKLMSRSETTSAMRFGDVGRETDARRSLKGDCLGRRSRRYLRSAWIGWSFCEVG
jgi:hypothetical protein